MPALTVNGQAYAFDMDPAMPLLWALRDGANLTGTKYGCGTGECGACTVIVDGAAAAACQLALSACEGRSVTTIEGLANNGTPHPVQAALVTDGAIQCGFCTPGIAMAAVALLTLNPDPSEADIDEAIPNLCRCGIYPRLVRAIRRAGQVMRARDRTNATNGAVPTSADNSGETP